MCVICLWHAMLPFFGIARPGTHYKGCRQGTRTDEGYAARDRGFAVTTYAYAQVCSLSFPLFLSILLFHTSLIYSIPPGLHVLTCLVSPPVPLPPFHPITHSLGSHCSTNVWTLFYICISSRTQSKQPLAWHIQVDYHNPLFVDDVVSVQMGNVRCDTR